MGKKYHKMKNEWRTNYPNNEERSLRGRTVGRLQSSIWLRWRVGIWENFFQKIQNEKKKNWIITKYIGWPKGVIWVTLYNSIAQPDLLNQYRTGYGFSSLYIWDGLNLEQSDFTLSIFVKISRSHPELLFLSFVLYLEHKMDMIFHLQTIAVCIIVYLRRVNFASS